MLKKKSFKVVLLVLFLLVISTLSIVFVPDFFDTIDNSFSIMSHTDKAPKLVAHRGLSSVYPQNTIPAFEGAIEYGFDGMECDIHTTKDGKWVIIHDETVEKMTDGEGAVADMTSEQIQSLTIDYGNGIENYKELKMPTFEEYLSLCEKHDIIPVIELKNCDEKYLPDLKEMIDSCKFIKEPVLISFNRDYLDAYREMDGEINMMLLATTPTKEDVQWCIDNNAGLNFNFASLIKCIGAVGMARENGVTLAAWTVDSPVYEDVMVLFGVEYITTNKLLP